MCILVRDGKTNGEKKRHLKSESWAEEMASWMRCLQPRVRTWAWMPRTHMKNSHDTANVPITRQETGRRTPRSLQPSQPGVHRSKWQEIGSNKVERQGVLWPPYTHALTHITQTHAHTKTHAHTHPPIIIHTYIHIVIERKTILFPLSSYLHSCSQDNTF